MGAPDFATACRQHDAYIAALEALDVKVTLLAERWDPKDAGLTW